MRAKCNLYRRIKFVLPFSVSFLMSVAHTNHPPFLPKATLKGEISWTLHTFLHSPNLYWQTVNISAFRYFMEQDKWNTSTLVPTEENNGRLVYWSSVFQLRILYSIVWYKKWFWMSVGKNWEGVLDSARNNMDSYEGRKGRDLNWTSIE
jgi:hypothetical protein